MRNPLQSPTPTHTLLAAVLVLALTQPVPMANADEALQSSTSSYYGGAKNESGYSVLSDETHLWAVGEDAAEAGLAVHYALPVSKGQKPSVVLNWNETSSGSNAAKTVFSDVAVSSEGLYVAGSMIQQAKKAKDDRRSGLLGKFPPTGVSGAVPLWMVRTDYYPTLGNEALNAVVPTVEMDATVLYAAGYATIRENNATALLAKYDSNGKLVWKKEIGNADAMQKSSATDLAVMDGDIYVAGFVSVAQKKPKFNKLPLKAALWKCNRAGDLLWTKTLTAELQPSEVLGFLGHDAKVSLAASDGSLYLAASKKDSPNSPGDLMLAKFDYKGELLWESGWKASRPDFSNLTMKGAHAFGVVSEGDRLYVSGLLYFTDALSFADDEDALLLEVDKDYGSVLGVHVSGDREHLERGFSVSGAGEGERIYAVGMRQDVKVNKKGKRTLGSSNLMMLEYTARPVTPVKVRVEPGFPQKVSVGIMTEGGFNAPVEVDPYSLRFGRTGSEANWSKCSAQDVDQNGTADLLCEFKTSWVPWKESAPIFLEGDGQGILTGNTHSGQRIMGTGALYPKETAKPAQTGPEPEPEPKPEPEPEPEPAPVESVPPLAPQPEPAPEPEPVENVSPLVPQSEPVVLAPSKKAIPTVKPIVVFTPAVRAPSPASAGTGTNAVSDKTTAPPVLQSLTPPAPLYSGESSAGLTEDPSYSDYSAATDGEDAALSTATDLALAYEKMAQDAVKEGRVKKAIYYYEEGIRLDPDMARLHTALGLLWIQEGDSQKAAEALRRALELDPDDKTAREKLDEMAAVLEPPIPEQSPAV